MLGFQEFILHLMRQHTVPQSIESAQHCPKRCKSYRWPRCTDYFEVHLLGPNTGGAGGRSSHACQVPTSCGPFKKEWGWSAVSTHRLCGAAGPS